MKNVKILSLGIAMLICFITNAQEKTVSENNSLRTEITAKSKDTIKIVKISQIIEQPVTSPTRVIVCAPSRSLINEPLYILDGNPINAKEFSTINPNDIQDIKVIKGTQTTSSYGNQGRNGVIIITTKKKYNQNNNDE